MLHQWVTMVFLQQHLSNTLPIAMVFSGGGDAPPAVDGGAATERREAGATAAAGEEAGGVLFEALGNN